MFLLYHSDQCNTSETVFHWCYVNDLHTTHAVVCWVTTSSLLNSMGCSDQYSVVAGGEVTARLTCRVMLFSSLFDLGTSCIIAVMCHLDGTYPSSSSRPWFGWS
jgi:hypothetical protein